MIINFLQYVDLILLFILVFDKFVILFLIKFVNKKESIIEALFNNILIIMNYNCYLYCYYYL
jgi:hypothetical protein